MTSLPKMVNNSVKCQKKQCTVKPQSSVCTVTHSWEIQVPTIQKMLGAYAAIGSRGQPVLFGTRQKPLAMRNVAALEVVD